MPLRQRNETVQKTCFVVTQEESFYNLLRRPVGVMDSVFVFHDLGWGSIPRDDRLGFSDRVSGSEFTPL